MNTQAGDGFGSPAAVPLSALLAAIASLRAGLESLPDPQSDDFYRNLVSVVERRLPPLYTAYDGYLSATLAAEGRRITCSSGCAACCRHFVSSVEPFELVALDHFLRARDDYGDLVVSSYRRTRVYDDILREEGDDENAEDRALYRYFLRGHACAFLNKDGTCGVYAWRPMSCRMFYSEASPRFCAGKELASPWNKNFQVELPQEAEEALARCSRVLENLGLSENLFPGLVEVNAAFGRYDAEAAATSPGPPEGAVHPPSSSVPCPGNPPGASGS